MAIPGARKRTGLLASRFLPGVVPSLPAARLHQKTDASAFGTPKTTGNRQLPRSLAGDACTPGWGRGDKN